VWNMYGPTETTVWSTCKRIDNPDDVTIGRPIANTRAYVLDGHLSPTPIGVPGDLYIGGAGVARGYVGRPDLTAQRFLDDPFHSGARMYKTGDRARLRGNGEILYLGRDDDQVKLRGHRIELGEIEAALAEQEHVRQAAAAICEDGAGDKRLVAYILSDKNALLTNSELRRFLRQRLPPYMVPNLFVELYEAPLTDNGKLDRRSLPDPFGWSKPAEHEYVPPRTSAERAVAAIWEQMLSVNRVGLSDNFFDLGGHSLLSTQMVYRVESETGIRINVRAILMETLGELLERTHLEQAHNSTSSVAAKAPGA